MDPLFREESLERLRSPEHFDETLRITSPRSWIVLLTLCLLISAGLVWGIFGRIATTVDGLGMLMDPRGLHPIVATLRGRLVEIDVKVGDKVSAGQVVATLVNPDTQKRLESERVTLSLLQGESAKASELIRREVKAKRKGLQVQRKGVENAIKIQENKIKWLESRLASYTDLFEKGLVLKSQLVQIGLERDNAVLEIDKLKGDLIRLSTLAAQEEESINRVINNPELVQAAMKRGPMIQVKGELLADPSTRSGYRWSSLKGRSINVSAGTLCTSEVVVKETAPITLVIPLIKSWIGS